MNIDTSTLILGIFASAIGTGYFVYGKKRARYVSLIAGIGLCVLPFLFDSLVVQILVCVVLAVIPWVWRE